MNSRKSWMDRQGIPTGVLGEVVDGITIAEENRATVYEDRREGVEFLTLWYRHYRSKGTKCVLFGVHEPDRIKYAVFVQPGFLRKVQTDT